MKKSVIVIAILLATFSLFSQNSTNQKPTLVVGIVIEQMRYDYLVRYWDKFSEHGFKKLVNQGTFCKNAHYDYLNINSASGYATISSGCYPAQHGVIDKKWYDRLTRKEVSCVEDETTFPIGTKFGKGASPKRLSTTTWTDQLRISTYKMSKVYSVGFNDYASVLSVGKIANTGFWFDENTGNWVTSSYYVDSLEIWTQTFNDRKFADIYMQKTWNTTFPISKYTESLSDETNYEIGLGGQNTFPYDLDALKKKFNNYSLLKFTPFANTLTKDFAINLLMNEYLGRDSYTDVLMINFAATTYISDVFGIQSVELQDAYIKLDKDIAHLISALDEFVGMNNVVVFVTSDRGACDNIQWLKDINIQVGEFNAKRTIVMLNSYLRAIYGMSNWVDGYYGNHIYLDHFEIDKAKVSVDEMQTKAAQLFAGLTGVSTIIPTNSLLKGTYSTGIMKKAQNSYFQSRSGDLAIVLDYGWRFQNDGKISLSECSSGYNENTHVPLIFYGWKIPHQEIYRFISLDALAVTLSFILDISLPNKATGEPIEEVLRNLN
ncbi:MAG TPA: alkaline phosphatase family protein [Bacteroidetes bacterium]|nr:alkaline phosphatase family protein [Bacteroidota bacterium]